MRAFSDAVAGHFYREVLTPWRAVTKRLLVRTGAAVGGSLLAAGCELAPSGYSPPH
jgi:hypothetical protein